MFEEISTLFHGTSAISAFLFLPFKNLLQKLREVKQDKTFMVAVGVANVVVGVVMVVMGVIKVVVGWMK